jgi:hypothetical protein
VLSTSVKYSRTSSTMRLARVLPVERQSLTKFGHMSSEHASSFNGSIVKSGPRIFAICK